MMHANDSCPDRETITLFRYLVVSNTIDLQNTRFIGAQSVWIDLLILSISYRYIDTKTHRRLQNYRQRRSISCHKNPCALRS
jgi:hypothetical protein